MMMTANTSQPAFPVNLNLQGDVEPSRYCDTLADLQILTSRYLSRTACHEITEENKTLQTHLEEERANNKIDWDGIKEIGEMNRAGAKRRRVETVDWKRHHDELEVANDELVEEKDRLNSRIEELTKKIEELESLLIVQVSLSEHRKEPEPEPEPLSIIELTQFQRLILQAVPESTFTPSSHKTYSEIDEKTKEVTYFSAVSYEQIVKIVWPQMGWAVPTTEASMKAKTKELADEINQMIGLRQLEPALLTYHKGHASAPKQAHKNDFRDKAQGLRKHSFIAVDMRLTDLAIRSLEAAEASDGNSIVVSKKRPAENQLVKQEDSFVLTAVHVLCGLIEKINLVQDPNGGQALQIVPDGSARLEEGDKATLSRLSCHPLLRSEGTLSAVKDVIVGGVHTQCSHTLNFDLESTIGEDWEVIESIGIENDRMGNSEDVDSRLVMAFVVQKVFNMVTRLGAHEYIIDIQIATDDSIMSAGVKKTMVKEYLEKGYIQYFEKQNTRIHTPALYQGFKKIKLGVYNRALGELNKWFPMESKIKRSIVWTNDNANLQIKFSKPTKAK